jgi:HSP20 family protein
MPIVRYSPFAGFDPFRGIAETVDRFFAEPNARMWAPPVDIRETDHELVVKADVPDMKFEDFHVRLDNGTLTISGERKFEEKKEEGGWHRVERSYGSFERAFALPDAVDPEGVKAEYKNGTLTVTLPKKELAKPRQIKVEATN